MAELSEEEQKRIMESPPKGTFAIIGIYAGIFTPTEAAVVAVACLATAGARGLIDDPFSHGEESSWWREGTRQLHARFPR